MKTPSKEEIRLKYGISTDDFQILESDSLPSPLELMHDASTIKKLGFWDRMEVWLKTTVCGGIVLAVIFIGELKDGACAIYDFGNLVYTNRDKIEYYALHFVDYAKTQAIGLLIHTENPPTEEDKQYPQLAIFSTGSLIYPLSSGWQQS